MAASSSIDPKQWDTLRKEARKLENEIDEKLAAYSKYSANAGAAPSGGVR
eukprot:CAMPEP_0196659844 /NCGR_PEP_ID=MMETSP1086-20130531/36828_1 /TAXON_ID=77921 /ORGANISM="Cyanoptyche  gloeocystis , Strain SAG4.97" /LENGTH=49 /DNA_ID= /DNA_START= /DNA_END= /DNA_ORIENTATION=